MYLRIVCILRQLRIVPRARSQWIATNAGTPTPACRCDAAHMVVEIKTLETSSCYARRHGRSTGIAAAGTIERPTGVATFMANAAAATEPSTAPQKKHALPLWLIITIAAVVLGAGARAGAGSRGRRGRGGGPRQSAWTLPPLSLTGRSGGFTLLGPLRQAVAGRATDRSQSVTGSGPRSRCARGGTTVVRADARIAARNTCQIAGCMRRLPYSQHCQELSAEKYFSAAALSCRRWTPASVPGPAMRPSADHF